MTVSTAPCLLVTCDLAHAVADHLAAAELHLLAVGGEILLHLDDEVGVGEPHAVAGGGAEHVGVGARSILTDMCCLIVNSFAAFHRACDACGDFDCVADRSLFRADLSLVRRSRSVQDRMSSVAKTRLAWVGCATAPTLSAMCTPV